jgi:DNA polymerase-3 subunit epsilon
MNYSKDQSNERSLVLDTETTGFYHDDGDRIIEVGIVELINRIPTGKTFHVYVDPRIEVSEGAYKVHGWSREDLVAESGGRGFEHIAEDLVNFINGDDLIIHNAPFDMGFLDMELVKLNMPPLSSLCKVFDTLVYSRSLFPGKKNSLDMLCKRYSIDIKGRDLHGALLDAQLLSEVFLNLTRNQSSLALSTDPTSAISGLIDKNGIAERLYLEGLDSLPIIEPDENERLSHLNIAKKLSEKYDDPSCAPWASRSISLDPSM